MLCGIIWVITAGCGLKLRTKRGAIPRFLFRPPGHVRAPGNLIITHRPPICQEENAKKIKKIIFPKHLTNCPICGILLVSRGDREHLFQVGLGTVCGGREKSAETLGKSQSSKKNSKNPLTNHSICDIIQIQSGGKSPLSALVRRHEECDPRESSKTY